jgi:hypothetical protein
MMMMNSTGGSMRKEEKDKVYEVLEMPVLLYGAKTWMDSECAVAETKSVRPVHFWSKND